jgi:hypothetical protein
LLLLPALLPLPLLLLMRLLLRLLMMMLMMLLLMLLLLLFAFASGESSGGSSVGFHLSSAKSKGLFSRAILESPGLTQSKNWDEAYGNTVATVGALTTVSE